MGYMSIMFPRCTKGVRQEVTVNATNYAYNIVTAYAQTENCCWGGGGSDLGTNYMQLCGLSSPCAVLLALTLFSGVRVLVHTRYHNRERVLVEIRCHNSKRGVLVEIRCQNSERGSQWRLDVTIVREGVSAHQMPQQCEGVLMEIGCHNSERGVLAEIRCQNSERGFQWRLDAKIVREGFQYTLDEEYLYRR